METSDVGRTAEGPVKKTGRKPAYRFSALSDIALLKEVIVAEPFNAAFGETLKKWEEVSMKCGNHYSGETGRKRFTMLLSNFKSDDAKQIKQSGTEEEHGEIEQLLQDIADRIKDAEGETKCKGKDKKSTIDDEKAKQIRDSAMEGISANARDNGSEVTNPSPVSVERSKKRMSDGRRIDV